MTKHWRLALAVSAVCAWGLVVPTASAQEAQPIRDRNQRIAIPGMSILPPQRGDWLLLPISPRENIPAGSVIRMFRRFEAPQKPQDARAVLAGVLVIDTGDARRRTPEEFLRDFTGDPNRPLGEMITRRQRLIGFETAVEASHGTTCVKYVRTTELTGQFPAFPDLVAISVTNGLYCSHPFSKQYVVDVTFQQLYAKGQKALPVLDDAEALFKTLVFSVAEPKGFRTLSAQLAAGMKAYHEKRWPEAEAAFQAAVGDVEVSHNDLLLASVLYYLGSISQQQRQLPQAEGLFQRALAIWDAMPDPDPEILALTLQDFGILYMGRGEWDRAEPLLKRVLALREQYLGPDDLQVGVALENLIVLYRNANRLADAERLGPRTLSIMEQQKGLRHEHLAVLLRTVIFVYMAEQKMAEAEPLMGRLISIVEETGGSNLASDYETYATILRGLNRPTEAQDLDARAKQLRQQ